MKKLTYFMLSISVLGFIILSCEKGTNPIEHQASNDEIPNSLSKKNVLKNFSENFEHDLSKWTGNRWQGWDYFAIIVDDPLRSDNKVVTFTDLRWGGDIYGSQDVAVRVEPGDKCVLTFEYLGIPDLGGVEDNLGGAIGIQILNDGDEPAGGVFVCTVCDPPRGCKEDLLIDDGQWHKYTVEFDPFDPEFYYGDPESNNTVVVIVEDWIRSDGVPLDALFDKIKLKVKKY